MMDEFKVLPPASPANAAVFPTFWWGYDAGVAFLKDSGWTDAEIAAIPETDGANPVECDAEHTMLVMRGRTDR